MKVFGLCGRKQSGKGTCANIIHGMVLRKMQLIDEYKISDKGELLIKSPNAMGGKEWVVFDITRRDPEFAEYAESTFWPFIKVYSFADCLKDIAVNLFHVPAECVYGTDEQKNAKIEHLLWENMPGVTTEVTPQDPVDEVVAGRLGKYYEKVLSGVVYHPKGAMTGREFMQFFGTEIMRKIWEPVWESYTINQVLSENTEIAIIADVRFPNEVAAIKNVPGNVLKLTRTIFDDGHSSETVLDNIPDSEYSRIIDNSKGTLRDLQKEIEILFTPIIDDLPIVEG